MRAFQIELTRLMEGVKPLANSDLFDLDHLYRIDTMKEDRISGPLRDKAICNLWILHCAYYSLSAETFVRAVLIADNFILKVRVKPKYSAILATAAYWMAARLHEESLSANTPEMMSELVRISKCGGTSQDMKCMVNIIESKFHCDPYAGTGSSVADFVRAYFVWLQRPGSAPASASLSGASVLRMLEGRVLSTACRCLCSMEAHLFSPAALAAAAIGWHLHQSERSGIAQHGDKGADMAPISDSSPSTPQSGQTALPQRMLFALSAYLEFCNIRLEDEEFRACVQFVERMAHRMSNTAADSPVVSTTRSVSQLRPQLRWTLSTRSRSSMTQMRRFAACPHTIAAASIDEKD